MHAFTLTQKESWNNNNFWMCVQFVHLAIICALWFRNKTTLNNVLTWNLWLSVNNIEFIDCLPEDYQHRCDYICKNCIKKLIENHYNSTQYSAQKSPSCFVSLAIYEDYNTMPLTTSKVNASYIDETCWRKLSLQLLCSQPMRHSIELNFISIPFPTLSSDCLQNILAILSHFKSLISTSTITVLLSDIISQ